MSKILKGRFWVKQKESSNFSEILLFLEERNICNVNNNLKTPTWNIPNKEIAKISIDLGKKDCFSEDHFAF